jgi:ACS family sodium-dependent inorganic phosphate cotransporter-like MFS transporter 5
LVTIFSLISLTFVTQSDPIVGVFLLTMGIGFIAIAFGAGFVVNTNEVCGKYSSVLFGISNTVSTLPGIIAPYVVSLLTQNVNDEKHDGSFCKFLFNKTFQT